MSRAPLPFAVLTLLLASACGGDAASAPSASPTGEPSPSARILGMDLASPDPQGELCRRVAGVEQRLAGLRAVELRLPNRVALDIELDKLQAAYVELESTDFGATEERLEGSLTRLGYRLGELELAVEDFRTNSRPRRAVPHVEEDAQKVADELAAFLILSRC